MSLNAIPLRTVPSVDPALAFQSERLFAVYDGGREISYTPFYAQNTNNSNIHVDFNPPDQQTGIYPQIYTDVGYKLKFTGVGPDAAGLLLAPGTMDGPRAFPTASTTSTVDLKLNGTSVTSNVNSYFHQMMRTGNNLSKFNLDYSKAPSMLDQYQEYGDWVDYGSARNPLALYGENSAQQTRGAFLVSELAPAYVEGVTNPLYNYQQNTHTAAVVTFQSVEPVMVSPFYHSKSCFFAKTFNGTWTFSDLKRVWSHAAPRDSTASSAQVVSGEITSLAVSITSFTVLVKFISPKLLDRIPRNITYDYHEILPLVTLKQYATPANTSDIFTMNSVNLDAIPKRLLVSVVEQDADLITGDLNYTLSDVCARINSITVNWANSQGKLSSASFPDLYDIYRNNGGTDTFVQWAKYTGGVLPIDLGRDIGLSDIDAPGKLANPQISMTVNYTNVARSAKQYALKVHVIYEGTFAILGGAVTKNIAVLTSQDILNTSMMDMVPLIENTEYRNMYGGGFWDKIKSGFNSVNDWLKSSKIISKVGKMIPHEGVKRVATAAESLGYGAGVVTMPTYYQNEEMMGGRKKRVVKKKK